MDSAGAPAQQVANQAAHDVNATNFGELDRDVDILSETGGLGTHEVSQQPIRANTGPRRNKPASGPSVGNVAALGPPRS